VDDTDAQPVVLVTGGSGLLGRRLIDRLRPHYRVVSIDLVGDPQLPSDVEFICTDMTSDDSVARALRRVTDVYGAQVASLVHLVAHYDFTGADSPLYDKITVEGTRRLLDAAKALELEQFVFSSTLLVHRPTAPGELTDEDSPLEPTWPYPESKVEAEEVIRSRDDVNTVILRLAGAYDEDGNSPPLTNQVRRIHARALTSRFYPAKLDRGQPFVHIDDAVDAMVRTVDHRADLPGDLALVVGEPTTLGFGEVQDIIGRALHGKRWRTVTMHPALTRPGAWLMEHNPLVSDPFMGTWAVDRADDHYELDITRARQLLGWEPRRRLREQLVTMVERMKADPEGWYDRNDLEPPRRPT
jgi:nucleoside-diphosphate-sugar epimerase